MSHQIGFKYALEGVWYALSTQPNFKVHLLATSVATIAGVGLHLSQAEWLILVFTVVLVFVAEMINTAIESMIDLIQEKEHQKAKIAKDVSAGMVLISAIAAVIVGLVIFVPKIVGVLSF